MKSDFGNIGIVGIFFVCFFMGITNESFGEESTNKTNLLIVMSDREWSGDFGRKGSVTSIVGDDFKFFEFSCSAEDSYSAKFRKRSSDGFLAVNILQDGNLLNYGILDEGPGTVSLTGNCTEQQVPQNNNGIISIFTDKKTYKYGETIMIDGFAKFLSYGKILTIEIEGNNGKKIFSKAFAISKDNKFTAFPRIYGLDWQNNAEYSINAYYDIKNKVKTPINVVYKEESKKPIPLNSVKGPFTNGSNGIYTELKIPKWVKETMEWYLNGRISEDELILTFQYLIDRSILEVT